jgi:hypothetical protein
MKPCIDCGKLHDINPGYLKRPNFKGRCKSCAGKHNKNQFKKVPTELQRHKDTEGYILVRIDPDSKFYSMAWKSGFIKEHRLIMAKHLGRCLQEDEIVHHLNNIRDDNRLENLSLETPSSHVGWHNAHGSYRGKATKREINRV